MIYAGVCSVTLRQASPEAVVALAASAELERIEWGADVHAPIDGPLSSIAMETRRSGLQVASYGSYFRGLVDDSAMETTILAAKTLGAPRIRVWAGDCEQPDAATRDGLIGRIRDFVVAARRESIVVGVEFHGGTLTSSADATLRVLDDVGEGLMSYWQPRLDATTEEAISDLRRLLPRLCGVHAFSWTSAGERLPLAARSELWAEALRIVAARDVDTDVLLEFVANDSPEQLMTDAGALRAMVSAAAS